MDDPVDYNYFLSHRLVLLLSFCCVALFNFQFNNEQDIHIPARSQDKFRISLFIKRFQQTASRDDTRHTNFSFYYLVAMIFTFSLRIEHTHQTAIGMIIIFL